ncbi:MAG: tetratricopeptide repeat protein [Elusimicrobia bacterium]|nr:tetratricopeptide repeat protein [Elusimicrobiota bacterium]
MRKLHALLLIPAIASVLCAPLSAQEEPDPLEETVAAVEKQAAAETPAAEISVEPAAKPAAPAAAKQAQPQQTRAESGKPAPVLPVWNVTAAPADSEWSFLQDATKDDSKDAAELLLPQLDDWLARNPAHPAAADAQLLKARLHERLGDHRSALVALLKHLQLYPGAASSAEARKMLDALLASKGDKKTRPLLEKAAAAPETAAADFNLAFLLRRLSTEAGAEYYEPLLAEFRYFFDRFPAYPANDEMRIALADLHLLNRNYLAAGLAYQKLVTMHPSSPLMARAKLSLADVLADRLKEYDKAIDVYLDIAASFPGSDQAWAAYMRLPDLAEKRRKYGIAVDAYEKIIALYPDKEEAYKSFLSEAKLLRERMGKFREAIAVLNRLADKYKDSRGPAGVDALLEAADIYRKDLKDIAGEVSMYERLAADFPRDPESPKALYAAGEVFYKAKDSEKARGYYQKILELYPEDGMSRKAEKRIAALMSGKY